MNFSTGLHNLMGILHNISTSLAVVPLASPTIGCDKYEDRNSPRNRNSATRNTAVIRRPFASAMEVHSKPAIVARNPSVVPKQKRIEPLPSGYAVWELCNDSEGYYWYVVIAFELDRPVKPVNGQRTSLND